jgi:hypothetical protein
MSLFSRQYGILNISQPYRPPQPITGIALLYFLSLSLLPNNAVNSEPTWHQNLVFTKIGKADSTEKYIQK